MLPYADGTVQALRPPHRMNDAYLVLVLPSATLSDSPIGLVIV